MYNFMIMLCYLVTTVSLLYTFLTISGWLADSINKLKKHLNLNKRKEDK